MLGNGRAVGEAGRGEIGRPAIERHREFPRRETRAVDDRLVIAGEEARRIAELADAHRNEIRLEELARRGAFQRSRLDRAGADLFERRAHRPGVAAGRRSRRGSMRLRMRLFGAERHRSHDRAAAREQGREGARMIVAGPAVELGPARRLERRIRDLQRPGAGIDGDRGQAAGAARNGARDITKTQVMHIAVVAASIGAVQRERAGRRRPPARSTERLAAAPPSRPPVPVSCPPRSRPASSWGRAR